MTALFPGVLIKFMEGRKKEVSGTVSIPFIGRAHTFPESLVEDFIVVATLGFEGNQESE